MVHSGGEAEVILKYERLKITILVFFVNIITNRLLCGAGHDRSDM